MPVSTLTCTRTFFLCCRAWAARQAAISRRNKATSRLAATAVGSLPRHDSHEEENRGVDASLPQAYTFGKVGDPEIIRSLCRQGPGRGQQAMSIGIGFHHGHDLYCRTAKLSQLMKIMSQGLQIDDEIDHSIGPLRLPGCKIIL